MQKFDYAHLSWQNVSELTLLYIYIYIYIYKKKSVKGYNVIMLANKYGNAWTV